MILCMDQPGHTVDFVSPLIWTIVVFVILAIVEMVVEPSAYMFKDKLTTNT